MTLKVTVKLFAIYRDRAGIGELGLDLAESTTVSVMLNSFLNRYPKVIGDKFRLVVAVNGEYQEHDYILSDGDEVALIPPVSGGGF